MKHCMLLSSGCSCLSNTAHATKQSDPTSQVSMESFVQHCTCRKADQYHITCQLELQFMAAHSIAYMTLHYMLLSSLRCFNKHCTCNKADLHHITGQLKLQTMAAHATVYRTQHYISLSSVYCFNKYCTCSKADQQHICAETRGQHDQQPGAKYTMPACACRKLHKLCSSGQIDAAAHTAKVAIMQKQQQQQQI